MEIPPSAFADIREEIERQPIPMNEYRYTSGAGRSQVFGVVGRRCLPPDASRLCWMRPKLYKHLLDFAEKYVDISWNAVTVNQNYKAAPHYDKNNLGVSFLVGFGDYKGGALRCFNTDLSGTHDVRHKAIIADFSKILHSVEDFEGERYSLVFYNFHNSRSVPLPPFSVKEEGGKYYFYRGDKRITRKEGLPHPLRNRKKTEPPPPEKKVVRFTVEFE